MLCLRKHTLKEKSWVRALQEGVVCFGQAEIIRVDLERAVSAGQVHVTGVYMDDVCAAVCFSASACAPKQRDKLSRNFYLECVNNSLAWLLDVEVRFLLRETWIGEIIEVFYLATKAILVGHLLTTFRTILNAMENTGIHWFLISKMMRSRWKDKIENTGIKKLSRKSKEWQKPHMSLSPISSS